MTVTVKVTEAVLPCLSVAVQVTLVSPIEKLLPEGGVQVATPGPSTTSYVVGDEKLTTLDAFLVLARISGIAEIEGAVVS